MPAPHFVLSPATVADVPALIDVYTSAFADNLFTLACLPRDKIPDEEWNRWLTKRFTNMFAKPGIRTFKVTDSSNNDRVAAFCRWTFPHVLTDEEKRAKEEDEKEQARRKREEGWNDAWPRGANLEVCDLKFGPLDARQKQIIKEEDSYDCGLLAVHQDYWRQGLGGMLLKYGLDLADSEGRLVWLGATAAGKPLYEKLGFKEVHLVEVDLTPWGFKGSGKNWGMLRQPQLKVTGAA